MSEKRRKAHGQRWDVARKLTDNEFWNVIEELFKNKEHEFNLEKVAQLTYRETAEFVSPLSLTVKHHIFIAVQYAPVMKKQVRKKYPPRNIQDRAGSIMSSMREQHERATGENLPLIHWESFAKEKMEAERKTGIRHTVRRKDTSSGFELENIYLKQVENGKRKYVTDFRPLDSGT